MSRDYIPAGDEEMIAWLRNLMPYLFAHSAELGLTPAELAPVAEAAMYCDYGHHWYVTTRTAADAARQKKDDKRAAFEAVIRPLVRRLQASATVTDAQRRAMGISVHDTRQAATATRPMATVNTAERLRHVIHFADEATPTSRARPDGAMGCEIWGKIGTTPADPSELTFLALDTRTPYTADFNGSDGGKTAHYMLRWVNADGEKGPWSATVSATIGG